MDKLLRQKLNFEIKAIDENEYTIDGVFSTSDEDRHGEIINQEGWKLKEFNENPVILFGHDQNLPAIGQGIGIKVVDGKLSGKIKFAVEEYELAKTVFNLYKGRFMRAFSVGFRNDKYTVDEENNTLILDENTLYEISCVNVPANAMALAKSKGFDLSSIEKLKSKNILKKETKDESKEISKDLIKNIKKAIRDDKANSVGQKVKIDTPKGKGVKFAKIKQINKAIRELQKEKVKIKKSIKEK